MFKKVNKLKNIKIDELAEELSGQYQGDLILSPDELRAYENGRDGKTGLINPRLLWPVAVIPYRVREEDFGKCSVAPSGFEIINISPTQMTNRSITFTWRRGKWRK